MKVLTLSRNYPNDVLPQLGLWVQGLVQALAGLCEVRVVSPVPYAPPLPGLPESFARFRRIPLRRARDGVIVDYPRFLVGPGSSSYSLEASTYTWGVRGPVDRLRAEFPFDLIHAHFIYPDGVAAARLAERYGVPVVTTEHALWQPWMDRYAHVRRLAIQAVRRCSLQMAASRQLAASIAQVTGQPDKIRLVPIGLNRAVFKLPPPGMARDPQQIVYIGRLQFVKGVDVLLRAVRRVTQRGQAIRLVLVGGSFYRQWNVEEQQLRALAHELGVDGQVAFVGPKSPAEVAQIMQQSAATVLPSRRESFGTVLIESLACGTPVIATRCGGPEDIVGAEQGLLVPVEDVGALAAAIETMLCQSDRYPRAALARQATERYAWDVVARQTMAVYQEALASAPTVARAPAVAATQ